MKDHRTPPTRCLACGYELDGVFDPVDGRPPVEGDLSICIRCRHLMAYDAALKMRELTGAEIVEVAGDPQIVAMMKALERAGRWTSG